MCEGDQREERSWSQDSLLSMSVKGRAKLEFSDLVHLRIFRRDLESGQGGIDCYWRR